MSSMGEEPGGPGGEGYQPPPGPPSPLRDSVGSAGERIQVIIEAAEKAAAGIIEDADAQARRYIDTSRRRADLLADERVRVMSDLTDTLIRQAEMVRRQSDELLAALDAARSELASRIGQELTTATPASGQQPAAQGQAGAFQGQPGGLQDQSGTFGPAPAEPAAGTRVPHLQPVENERPDLQAVQPEVASQPATPPSPPQPPYPQQPQPPYPQQPQGVPEQSATAPPPLTPRAAAPPAAGPTGPIPSDGARLLAAQMAVAGSSRQQIEARLRDEFGIQDAGPILDGILGPG